MHMARLTALYGAQNIKVVDTRLLPEKRPEHARIASELELSMDRLKPVVHIQDNSENIYKPLEEVWKTKEHSNKIKLYTNTSDF